MQCEAYQVQAACSPGQPGQCAEWAGQACTVPQAPPAEIRPPAGNPSAIVPTILNIVRIIFMPSCNFFVDYSARTIYWKLSMLDQIDALSRLLTTSSNKYPEDENAPELLRQLQALKEEIKAELK